MSMATRAFLLVLFFSLGVSARAETRTLALYSGPARGLDAQSNEILQVELARLLSAANFQVIWKNSGERKTGEDFDSVVVGSFEGSCALAEPDIADGLSSLGDTSISAGHVLPFFRVDCSRVIQMLKASMENLDLHERHALLGRALARVMAHEIYHIVAKTAEHQYSGVAKASFSVRDLTTTRFEFDIASLTRMSPEVAATASEFGDANSAGR